MFPKTALGVIHVIPAIPACPVRPESGASSPWPELATAAAPPLVILDAVARRAGQRGLVRFAPKATEVLRCRKASLCAISDIGALRKPADYSITSSAVASSVAGTVSPSAFAIFKLSTSSYLVGACTGRSAGLSPLRMRST
jgi:hypothetical protein